MLKIRRRREPIRLFDHVRSMNTGVQGAGEADDLPLCGCYCSRVVSAQRRLLHIEHVSATGMLSWPISASLKPVLDSSPAGDGLL